MLPSVAAILLGLAHAGDRPDVELTWTEPTCEQRHLDAAAKARAASVCGATRPARVTYQYQQSGNPLGCHVWVHAWCPAGRAPGFQPPGSVVLPTLYADNDFKGTALPLDVGEWQLVHVPMRSGGDWRQKAGSVRVPAGFTLRLCTEAGGGGRCSDFTSDAHRLQEAFVGNDAAAYARVGRGALPPAYACPRVYEHDGFGGKYLEVCNDQPDLTGSPWNDSISSILVPAGWAVELCANAQHQAPCHEFAGDARALGGTVVGPDTTTSIKITRRPR